MRYEYSVVAIHRNGRKETFFFLTEKEAIGFKQAMQQFGSQLNIVSTEEVVELHPRNTYHPTSDLLEWLSVWAN